MKIWAGIVTYNPDLARLKKNVDSIYTQVSNVIIFDNGSQNQIDVIEFVKNYERILVIKSDKNKGLAYGLNQVCKQAVSDNVDWILLLDQDSVSEENCIKAYSKYLNLEKAAILCPVMFDSRRRAKKINRSEGHSEVKECIQSGALYSVRILRKLKYFDEWYFIDYIDYDYCISVRRKGYKIYQINSLILDQEASTIEHVFCHNFLFKLAKITNIDLFAKLSYRPVIKPWRSFYTARNRVYYIYKNSDMLNVPTERLKGLFDNLRNIIRIPDHIGTAKAIIKGTSDGYKKVREMKL